VQIVLWPCHKGKEKGKVQFPDKRFKEKRNGKPKVKQLWDRQNKILDLVSKGFTNVEIANAVGVTTQNVSDIKNSDLGRSKLEILRALNGVDNASIQQRLNETTPFAIGLIEEIILGVGDGSEASLALRAKYAEKHLERVGLGGIKKQVTASGNLTRERIEEIKERAFREKSSSMEGMEGAIDITPERVLRQRE
jgi:hypothetical protein